MRRALVAAVTALFLIAPVSAAFAGPGDGVIQPVRCQIGDRTGVYVGGKCSGPY